MFNLKEKKTIKKIADKYFLDLILLFGSRASGKNYKRSDFDIAYLGRKELDLNKEAGLILELSSVFKSENIDLVNIKKSSPLLFYAITKECRIIYEKNPVIFPALRAYAFKKYIETKPLYEEKFKRLRNKIKGSNR
ncbi:MAG: nucleotidyltransferase domain-containing protein [Candidatus Pacebacteria bacterium]|nr:nucleotidyltransferase domain-containing protein [Candidatus Paceibacterota bacterium]